MKSVLITGASGLLGRELMTEFSASAEFAVQGTALTRTTDTVHRLDLRNETEIREFMMRYQPDIVIHSAALRRPDICENDSELTRSVNVDATRILAECVRDTGAWLIYLSTDYVFDGTAPPYAPDAAANPLNYYGRSKRDGELAVQSALSDGCILRVPILYGPVESLDESAVTTIAKSILALDGGQLLLDNLAIRYPTLTTDVARLCIGVVNHRLENPGFGGIIHWSGDEPMTKYRMGVEICSILGVDPGQLLPDNDPPVTAPRPQDSHLDCSLLQELGLVRNTPFTEGLTRIFHQ